MLFKFCPKFEGRYGLFKFTTLQKLRIHASYKFFFNPLVFPQILVELDIIHTHFPGANVDSQR